MKQNMKKVVCMAVIGALAVTSAVGNNVTSEAAAKKIVMNKTKVSLKEGQSFKLKVKKVKPASLGKKVTYKSNKTKIAAVSKTGKITAKSKGKATITVTSKKNKKVKAKVTVTVTKKQTTVTPSTAPNTVPSTAPNTVPSTAPAIVPSSAPSTAPSVAPSKAPSTAPSKQPPTTAPSKAPTPTPTPNIIDLDEYKIDLSESLKENEYYDREDNADGSVTLTRGHSDDYEPNSATSWKVGEFGIELPRDKVGDQHKFKGIVIKFRDSTLTDPTYEVESDGKIKHQGICGYVIHSVAQCEEIENSGKADKIGWFDFQDNPKEKGHDESLLFDGTGEVTIKVDDDESDFSTVRIYDGMFGGKITIESITVIKMDTPDEPETPVAETVDLSKASAYVCDGNDVEPSYNNDTGCLDVKIPQYQGIIVKVPDDGKTYKKVKITYTLDTALNFYLFDGAMTDGKGQTPDGQKQIMSGLAAAPEETTVEFEAADDYVGKCLKGIKIVHVDNNNSAAKNISIKSIVFIP